jgi:hypothetical protein
LQAVTAAPLKISEVEERELRLRAGQYTRPYREVIRAKSDRRSQGARVRVAGRVGPADLQVVGD